MATLPPKTKREARSRPTYHYFYGSTNTDEIPLSPQVSENDVLFGESLVPTDNEEDTPNSSARDLRQLVITNGFSNSSLDQLGEEAEPFLTDKKGRPMSPQCEKGCFSKVFECFLNIGGSHPVGHVARVIVLVTMTVLMYTLMTVLKPRAPTSATGSVNRGPTPTLQIPYPIVDRAEYDDPASKVINAALFDPSLLFNMGKINEATGASLKSNTNVDPVLKVPFPTGAFWTNLVMDATANGYSFPIVSYPYAFKWSDSILQVSYPFIRRRIDTRSVRDIFEPDVSFGVLEQVSKRHITRFDPLSVTLRFYTAGITDDGYWESYIVHGSPYITVKYLDAKPVLKALSTFQKVMCPFDADGNYYDGGDGSNMIDGSPTRKLKWGVCTPSDGSGDDGTAVLHGVQFLIQTQEKMTWILFSSEVIELSFDTRRRTQIVATKKFSGVLRLALIPPSNADPDETKSDDSTVELVRLSESTGLKRLVYHAGIYPTGGSVSWDFKSTSAPASSMTEIALKAITGPTIGGISNGPSAAPGKRKVGTVHFKYETQQWNQNANSKMDLLMLGLPHHADVLSADSMLGDSQFDLHYWCIKGKMVPVVGSTWSYDERLTNTQFDRASDISVDPDVAKLILHNIKTDMHLFPTVKTLNIYGYGKQVARLAQLAHIAKVATRQSNSTSKILDEITDKLHDSLVALLSGQVEDELLYDAKFGGIVSKNGLSNVGEDFGNGRYNDHHFHYGYLLYASAVLGSLNSSFVEQHGAAVDSLLYDIAYKGNGDSLAVDSVFFPLARHKSWYDGHSFAAGLFQQANGKSQESTSEAINGYYGAYLWSMVKNSVGAGDLSGDFRDYLRLLLAMEIRGTKKYWQMMPRPAPGRSAVYDASFRKNYMVGNLGMLDAVSSTYFAKELFYVHLIQIIPVTAITTEVFGQAYAKQQYNNVVAKAEIPTAWKGYAICNQAITDPSAAWEQAMELVSVRLDSGLSKSQVLYFISTLEGFEAPNITGIGGTSMDDDSSSDSSSAACENHPGCSGLTGFCCPTRDGIMLGCCQ